MKDEFYPAWYEEIPPEKSYRSILKWGASDQFKHPNRRLFRMMKETFKMTDEDFKTPKKMGLETVSAVIPIGLSEKQVSCFENILGKENVLRDTYSRLKLSYGKTMIDLMRLRNGIIENIPELVLQPRDKEDVRKIVEYCNLEKIPVYVFGGGSTVTRGTECVKGGVSLDTRVHMKRVLKLSETNQTVTVEPGIQGPALESMLNHAPNLFNTHRAYTCGHFPQSFEYSSVGGWVVTRGAGQNSTYYGKIENLVIAQEYITPAGTIKTAEYPACSTGPSIDEIMLGSEGAYGILVSVTLKIFRYRPQNRQRFSFMFRNWEDAKNCVREVMQGEFGYPSVFRLSDPEETDVAIKLYGFEGSLIDTFLSLRGFKPGERCLLLGTADGERGFARHIDKMVHHVCRRYGAMSTTGYPVRKWEQSRFTDPYMRDDMQDFGIITDTLECAVNWEQLEHVYKTVRSFCKSRPDTVCMTHLSHFYPQGVNLYFIFIGKMDSIEEYLLYQAGLLDHIQKSGAAMSHHHGIGKMTSPWLEAQIGKNQLEIFKALKKHFDPNNILNPGGTLALDLPEEQKRNLWTD
ncbi:MAG: FAD-binding oxidoreductase [Spirochaetota bacterium]